MSVKGLFVASTFLVAVQIPGAYLGATTGWDVMDHFKKSGKPFDEATYLQEFDFAARKFPDPVQWVTSVGIGGFLLAEKFTPPVYNAFGA